MATRRYTHDLVKNRSDGRRLETYYYGGNALILAIYYWEKEYGDGYKKIINGCDWYRKGERDGMYVIDYSNDCGVTWELDLVQFELDEDIIIINIDNGVVGYRQVVRDSAYCIDQKLTSLGFYGVENIDWENIFYLKTE